MSSSNINFVLCCTSTVHELNFLFLIVTHCLISICGPGCSWSYRLLHCWIGDMKTGDLDDWEIVMLKSMSVNVRKALVINNELLYGIFLTHWGRVTHTCIGNLGHHWFRYLLVVFSVPCHYLNQCWNIVNWTLSNKLQLNLNRNINIFVDENAYENVVCKIAAILSRPLCLNNVGPCLFCILINREEEV